MIDFKGTIEDITKENNNGRDKKVLTLVSGNETLFIEFQGKFMSRLDPFNIGNHVEIRFRFNGKVSKLNRKYNNLIGKSIKLQ